MLGLGNIDKILIYCMHLFHNINKQLYGRFSDKSTEKLFMNQVPDFGYSSIINTGNGKSIIARSVMILQIHNAI